LRGIKYPATPAFLKIFIFLLRINFTSLTSLSLSLNFFTLQIKSIIMATAKLNGFTRAELTEAVAQILNSGKFWVANSHIPAPSRAAIKDNILRNGAWPPVPVFSPYAKTHDGYSQSESSFNPALLW
jgi:hypothetical protein